MRLFNTVSRILGLGLLCVFLAELFRALGVPDQAILSGAIGLLLVVITTRPQAYVARARPKITITNDEEKK